MVAQSPANPRTRESGRAKRRSTPLGQCDGVSRCRRRGRRAGRRSRRRRGRRGRGWRRRGGRWRRRAARRRCHSASAVVGVGVGRRRGAAPISCLVGSASLGALAEVGVHEQLPGLARILPAVHRGALVVVDRRLGVRAGPRCDADLRGEADRPGVGGVGRVRHADRSGLGRRPPVHRRAGCPTIEATFSIDSVVSLATCGSITRLPLLLCWYSTLPLASVTFCTK